MSWPRDAVQAALPVQVREIEYNDPMLTLIGQGWALNLGCPWDGEVNSTPLSWEDDDVEDRAWDFIGADLLAVSDTTQGQVDFLFSNGVLRARPDTDLDPWVMHLPGVIVVGTMN